MDECKIVTDLLPLYCDELTGEETNTFIRSHLNSCPECSSLLEKMQQKRMRQKEMDNQQAEFRAAMAGYQQRHRRRVRLVAGLCLLLVVLFFVLRAFSFDIAIAASGLRRGSLKVVQEPTTDPFGKSFQIVFSETKDGRAALAELDQNIFGFWTLDYVATPDPTYSAAQMGWWEQQLSNHFGEPHIGMVFHGIYAGYNAIDSIDKLPRECIPNNVAVIVNQHSSSYYIHVISVWYDGVPSFEILPLLKEHNLIS